MFSVKLSTRNFVSVLTFAFGFPAFLAIIPETFAQTPNAATAAALSSLPNDVALATRPRRVEADTSPNDPAPLVAAGIEQRAFEATNAARVANGLAPLVWDDELCRMARVHSEKMVRLRFFSHETPDGAQFKDRARLAGIIHFQMIGENIAYNQGFEDPGGFAVSRWMFSPGHRANILNPQFKQSAIGVFIAPDGTVYLTQEFIAR